MFLRKFGPSAISYLRNYSRSKNMSSWKFFVAVQRPLTGCVLIVDNGFCGSKLFSVSVMEFKMSCRSSLIIQTKNVLEVQDASR